MRRSRFPSVLSVLVALLACWLASVSDRARADDRVDLLLALTVDVSLSMDLDEQRLQRDGYVAAFRDPLVLAAITSGARQRIAVTYIEWAGPAVQSTVVPWTVVDGPEAAERIAARLERTQISRARMTSISGALLYAASELERAPWQAPRRVIDVSGDGPNNAGPPVVPTRDELVARDIVINGLPLLLKTDGPNSSFDIANLDAYYAECVIGGTGAFSIPVRDKAEFAAAIRQKLVIEISGLVPPPQRAGPRLVPTQGAGPPAAGERDKGGPVDCLIGEKLWRRYLDGRFYR